MPGSGLCISAKGRTDGYLAWRRYAGPKDAGVVFVGVAAEAVPVVAVRLANAALIAIRQDVCSILNP